jgi:hypothetical protein
MRIRIAAYGLLCFFVLLLSSVALTAAQSTETQDVLVTLVDDGEFTISLGRADSEQIASFGTIPVDAVEDVTKSITLELHYTDTHVNRSGGQVTLSASVFLPTSPIPSFPGSSDAVFQIPDRYLVLQQIGAVNVETPSDCDPLGAISAPSNVSEIQGTSFDGETPLVIAEVTEGCGVGQATQEIELSLTVPAGVYPTEYASVLTIETTVDDLP